LPLNIYEIGWINCNSGKTYQTFSLLLAIICHMNLLSVENITKTLGFRVLLNGVSFGISKGEKVALVGKNGTGKSTLFNMISGRDTPDTGVITLRKGVQVIFLPQDPEIKPNISLFDAIYSGDNKALDAIREYEFAILNHEDGKALEKAMDLMETHQAWDYEARIKQILTELRLDDLTRNTSSLSGGQKKRFALALALIQEPEFLILDEPTNHLDLEMIEWLEEYLSYSNLTLLMVTHDRYFLDRVCKTILEIDRSEIFRYQGNYTYFTEKKAERVAAEQTQIEKAKNLFKKELEWMRRQPQARTTKSKSRISAFYDLEIRAKQRVAEQKVKLEMVMKRLGGKILEIEHLKKSFGTLQILNDFSYTFKQKDRIGIIGENGTGKSTFLKIITGQIPADSGRLEKGESVVFGHFQQEGIKLEEDKRVIEVIKEIAEFLPLAKNKVMSASQLLDKFLFEGDQQYTMVSKLSGGEKRRLYLCTLLIKNPNFLILDEPTNDLDIETLSVLEDFLEEFNGCLLIVSHDRYFMDKLVDHLFVFEGQGVVNEFNGNYSDYREEIEEKIILEKMGKSLPEQVVTQAPVEIAPVNSGSPKKLSFKETQELSQIEEKMGTFEKRKSEIHEIFSQPDQSGQDLNSLSNELLDLDKKINEMEGRWLELQEKMA